MSFDEAIVNPKDANWLPELVDDKQYKYRFVFDVSPLLDMARTSDQNMIIQVVLNKAKKEYCDEQNIKWKYSYLGVNVHDVYTSHVSWIVEMRMTKPTTPSYEGYLLKKLRRIEERDD
jgi:hypothetical protein